MSLKRWLSVIMTMGLILAFSPLGAQARPYYHPHGKAYGRYKARHHGFYRRHKHFRHRGRGPHRPHYRERAYGGPPPVAYVAPVAPVIGIPYAQPQPYYSQPAIPGLSGQIQWNF
jgi:hypothetical protein